ncbi:MAG: cyclic nucleotide-binding domain-containing protein [Desulfobacteraceae bacterium]|nr:cyclic nucleotide-binding domain-containing protein [Desulfobacteraceae bacterium]
MGSSEIQEALENCEFFQGLEPDHIKKIASLCQVETYETGEYIFRQGDFGEHIYVITQGRTFLERSLDLGTRTGSAVIGILGRGRVFGCWSTLLAEPHNLMASASSEKDSKVLAIKGAELREMMLSHVALGFRVLERLCFLLRDRIQGAYGAMERV